VAGHDVIEIRREILLEEVSRMDVPLGRRIDRPDFLPDRVEPFVFTGSDEGRIAAADVEYLSAELLAVSLDPIERDPIIVLRRVRINRGILISIPGRELLLGAGDPLDERPASRALDNRQAVLRLDVLEAARSADAFLNQRPFPRAQSRDLSGKDVRAEPSVRFITTPPPIVSRRLAALSNSGRKIPTYR